jgi:hypothetical protein
VHVPWLQSGHAVTNVLVGVGMCVDVGGWTVTVTRRVSVTETEREPEIRRVFVLVAVTSFDRVVVRLPKETDLRRVREVVGGGVSDRVTSDEAVGVGVKVCFDTDGDCMEFVTSLESDNVLLCDMVTLRFVNVRSNDTVPVNSNVFV